MKLAKRPPMADHSLSKTRFGKHILKQYNNVSKSKNTYTLCLRLCRMPYLLSLVPYVLCLVFTFNSLAQGVSINTTGNDAAGSAILDVSSSTQGVLISRMTQTERNAIVDPVSGLQIFNTTTGCFNFYTGTTWKQICGDCDFNTPIPGNNGPICQGSTLNLTATAIIDATYQWAGPNGFTSTLQNPSISNATAAASGSYSVTATKNGCTSTPQSTVSTVNTTPATPTAGNDGSVCVGSILNLSASSILGATYSWTGPNGYSASVQNPIITSAALTHAGTYNVTATVNGCISVAGNTNIIVYSSAPATPGDISPASACPNSTGNVYSITAVSNATTYTWTVPSGASITTGQGTTSITVSFGANLGNITVTASNPCGTSSVSSKAVAFATGGTITSIGGYTIHTFTSSGTFTPTCSRNVDVLVVAGGGGGGYGDSGSGMGGGGAGGFVSATGFAVSQGSYTVTIGAGGTGAVFSGLVPSVNGENSVFSSITAIGGGAGSNSNSGATNGANGGSGGGGSGFNIYPGGSGGSGTTNQGNSGGNGGNSGNGAGYKSGGGGGAGLRGQDANEVSATAGCNGGIGLESSISGSPVYYAGGGGGGVIWSGWVSAMTGGLGGDGGGGNGGSSGSSPGTATNGTNATPNTGGGGGGAAYQVNGGAGGSGIVIVRYPN